MLTLLRQTEVEQVSNLTGSHILVEQVSNLLKTKCFG